MSDIVEFLRARLDEDERVANGMLRDISPHVLPNVWKMAKRSLREVEAKRAMIGVAGRMAATVDGEWGCCHTAEHIISGGLGEDCNGPDVLVQVLGPLVSIYNEHPDFDPEWVEET